MPRIVLPMLLTLNVLVVKLEDGLIPASVTVEALHCEVNIKEMSFFNLLLFILYCQYGIFKKLPLSLFPLLP